MSYMNNSYAMPQMGTYSAGIESRVYSSAPLYSVAFSASNDYQASSCCQSPIQLPTHNHSESMNMMYSKTASISYQAAKANPIMHEYMFIPDNFLNPSRTAQPFINAAEDIEEAVKEAFLETTKRQFPKDIRITIMEEEAFRKQAPDPSVVGFSINRSEHNLISDVVILAGSKDRVLLTIGHEIGHVLTPTLNSKHDEEAKAFAFTQAWMESIRNNDIAGLANSIIKENPARNGLHDIAFSFVADALKDGKEALALYLALVNGMDGVSADAFDV